MNWLTTLKKITSKKEALDSRYTLIQYNQRNIQIPNTILNPLFNKNNTKTEKSDLHLLTYEVAINASNKPATKQTIVHLQDTTKALLFKGECVHKNASTQNLQHHINRKEFAHYPIALRFHSSQYFEKAVRHIQTTEKTTRHKAIAHMLLKALPQNTQEAHLPQGAEILTVKDINGAFPLEEFNRYLNPTNPNFVESPHIKEKRQHGHQQQHEANRILQGSTLKNTQLASSEDPIKEVSTSFTRSFHR